MEVEGLLPFSQALYSEPAEPSAQPQTPVPSSFWRVGSVSRQTRSDLPHALYVPRPAGRSVCRADCRPQH